MNSPAEILQIWIGNSVKKATLPTFKMILLGIAAGIYIGFGCHGFLLSTAAAETVFEAGIAKLVGSALFPLLCWLRSGSPQTAREHSSSPSPIRTVRT